METKSTKHKMESIQVKLGFTGFFVVNPVGRSVVKMTNNTTPWRLMGFYCHHDWTKRRESWTLLNHLKQFSLVPRLCIEDFNKVVDQTEKRGGVLWREGQMVQFKEVLQECGSVTWGTKSLNLLGPTVGMMEASSMRDWIVASPIKFGTTSIK